MTITKYFQDKEIRLHITDSETLVCVRDILDAIGYKNPAKAWLDMKDEVELISKSHVVSKQVYYPI